MQITCDASLDPEGLLAEVDCVVNSLVAGLQLP